MRAVAKHSKQEIPEGPTTHLPATMPVCLGHATSFIISFIPARDTAAATCPISAGEPRSIARIPIPPPLAPRRAWGRSMSPRTEESLPQCLESDLSAELIVTSAEVDAIAMLLGDDLRDFLDALL